MNIFEMLYPRFYFDKSKTIRLFEAFSGVGCQAMALKRITDNIELVGISEIDKPAIQSYMAIHGQVKNYGDITKMVSIPPCDIFTWSFPCTDLSKAGKQKGLTDTRSGLVYEVLRLLRETANYYPFHRHIPKNSKIHSMGLSTDYYQPIPDKSKLPKILIMENVIDLVQVKFVKAFNEIQAELEQLGYTNYNEVLNAKDYGIPQNRERVFMVSILGDKENDHYSYDFPLRQELKLRLKDLLEDEVDEKYYLSKKALKTLTAPNTGKYQRAKAFEFNIKKTIEQGIIGSIPAGDRSGALDPYYAEAQLLQVAQLDGFESSGRIYDENGLAPTINTMGGGQREPKVMVKTWNDETKAYKTKEDDMPRDRIYTDESNIGFTITTNSNQQLFIMQKSRGYNKGGKHKDCPPITANSYQENNFVAIPETTEKGYAEAHDGDGVYVNRPHQKRGVVQKGMIQTIKTSDDDIGVVLKVDDTDVYSDEFEIIEIENKAYIRIKGELFRIRKLTPLECWRLMGISDEDFYKAKFGNDYRIIMNIMNSSYPLSAKLNFIKKFKEANSNSQLYKQAGNGIVVNVFETILRELIK